jgi:hypothetical protein
LTKSLACVNADLIVTLVNFLTNDFKVNHLH